MDDTLFTLSIYNTPASVKEPWLLERLNSLIYKHRRNCSLYNNFLNGYGLTPEWQARSLEEIPPLVVRLFKHLELISISKSEIFKTLFSSGTTGAPSRIFLDRYTAQLQSKALVRILQHWLGKQRLPMLIIDHPDVIKDAKAFSARGAGIQGVSFFGRDHAYALKEDMEPDWESIEGFCTRHQKEPVLLFGFTFMVWECFLKNIEKQGRRLQLPQGVLLHGGGWKKLSSKAVSPDDFNKNVEDLLGVRRVHDYYGMVEQVGSIFVECEQGHLHTPVFADVIVRSPGDWLPLPTGQQGVVEVLSVLPWSYPGQALLTDDLGVILGKDDCPCGKMGRYFRILGRIPKAEARGCSDTFIHEGKV